MAGRRRSAAAEKHSVTLGDTAPIAYLKNARGFVPDGLIACSWQGKAGRFNVYSACSAPSEAIYAEGPGNPTTDTLTYFIQRVTDSDDIVYANIFELEQGAAKIGNPTISIDGGTVTMRFRYGEEMREHVFTVGEAE